tara:strand:+ start:310 stop:1098 length:789 start_codon:yes stop_codon:yes gene_type:complete
MASESIVREHKIEIDENRIGAFVGRSGYFVKTKVVFPSRSAYMLDIGEVKNEDGEFPKENWEQVRIHCHVDKGDDGVIVTLKCMNEALHDVAHQHLLKYVEEFNMPKESKGVSKPRITGKARPNSNKNVTNKSSGVGFRKYVYKVLISDEYIGRLIGVEGSNVSEFSEFLKQSLDIPEKSRRPYVRIMTEGSDRANSINIDGVDTGEIWISVQYNGIKSFSNVKQYVSKFVSDTLVDTLSDEEVSGWVDGDSEGVDTSTGGW